MNKVSKNNLPDLLLALRRKINKSTKESRITNELTASQIEVLWFIHTCGKRTMDSIAEHLNVKPPSVTPLIDTMVQQGLVSREKEAMDRRVVYISLTLKTKRQIAALRKQKQTAFNKILSKLSQKDQKELERILTILTLTE